MNFSFVCAKRHFFAVDKVDKIVDTCSVFNCKGEPDPVVICLGQRFHGRAFHGHIVFIEGIHVSNAVYHEIRGNFAVGIRKGRTIKTGIVHFDVDFSGHVGIAVFDARGFNADDAPLISIGFVFCKRAADFKRQVAAALGNDLAVDLGKSVIEEEIFLAQSVFKLRAADFKRNAEPLGAEVNAIHVGRQRDLRKIHVNVHASVDIFERYAITICGKIRGVLIGETDVIAAVRVGFDAVHRSHQRKQLLWGRFFDFIRRGVVRIQIPNFNVVWRQSVKFDFIRTDRRGIAAALAEFNRSGGDGCLVFRLIGVLFARRKSGYQHQHREHEREDLLHFYHICTPFK